MQGKEVWPHCWSTAAWGQVLHQACNKTSPQLPPSLSLCSVSGCGLAQVDCGNHHGYHLLVWLAAAYAVLWGFVSSLNMLYPLLCPSQKQLHGTGPTESILVSIYLFQVPQACTVRDCYIDSCLSSSVMLRQHNSPTQRSVRIDIFNWLHVRAGKCLWASAAFVRVLWNSVMGT